MISFKEKVKMLLGRELFKKAKDAIGAYQKMAKLNNNTKEKNLIKKKCEMIDAEKIFLLLHRYDNEKSSASDEELLNKHCRRHRFTSYQGEESNSNNLGSANESSSSIMTYLKRFGSQDEKSEKELDLDLDLQDTRISIQHLAEKQIIKMLESCSIFQEQLFNQMNVNNNETSLKENEKVLLDKLGFVPEIRESSIPGAGEGLFMKGSCKAGSIISLFPGIVFLPHHIDQIKRSHQASNDGSDAYLRLFGSSNPHVIQMFDGTIIDASYYEDSPELISSNPFASGHKINHPPKGQQATVLKYQFVFPDSIPDRLRNSIPNNFATAKNKGIHTIFSDDGRTIISPRKSIAKTIVMIAKRDIKDGEEIFVDYRYNPELPKDLIPSWYHPIDEESSKLRWGLQ